jgi:4-amino-4-deoxy-L-arabinose transferase-like glycosyltransferase
MLIETQTTDTVGEQYQKGKINYALLAILVLALVLRLLVWLLAPHPNFVIDEAEYYQIASILADGRGWFFYESATWVRPPLYILLIAGIFEFFGANLIIVRLVQIIISLATIYMLFRLGWKLYGQKTGLWAAGLAAVAWQFVVFPYLLLSETLFLLLFLGGVYCLTEFLLPATAREGAWLPKSLKEWLWLGGGGVLLGLSALTRGQVLSFMPFVGLWLLIAVQWRRWKTAIGASLIIGVLFAATVAPWALRNASVYGRPFIDTTGGYNFYLGALKGRNGALVSQTLEAVKNQADRDQLGYQKGLEVFWSNPADFIFGKGVKETLDFWQINYGADERLLEAYTKGVINPYWLTLDAIFNDFLYIIAGILAFIGLVVAPATGRGMRSFVTIWTMQNVLLAFTFFAVTRFRLSVYFFLLLFAAYTLAYRQEVMAYFKQGWRNVAKVLALPVVFLAMVLPSFSPVYAIWNNPDLNWFEKQPTLVGLKSWFDQEHAKRGDELRLAGKYPEALAEYAKADQKIPATQIGIGLTEAAQGNFETAIGRIGRTSQDIAQSHLALGAIYLLQGNADFARGEFNSRQISLDPQADDWAWDNLPVKALPQNTLRVGEFDWGYVKGFHINERENNKNFRWTSGRGDDGQGRALLRFPQAGKPTQVSLELKGYRPTPLASPNVSIYANGQFLGNIQTGNNWQTYTLNLPAGLPADIIIELGANTFVPGAESRRELGVMVGMVKLT